MEVTVIASKQTMINDDYNDDYDDEIEDVLQVALFPMIAFFFFITINHSSDKAPHKKERNTVSASCLGCYGETNYERTMFPPCSVQN